MIEVVTHRILVKPYSIDEKDTAYAAAKRMNLEIVGETKDREQRSVDKGVVVSFGPTAFVDMNTPNPLKAGDEIVWARHAGKEIIDPETEEKFLALNDEDVIAILKNGAKDGY